MPVWTPCPPDPASGIAGAYLAACQTELRALKPGNVHIHAAGHGMAVEQFLASAEATAPIMARPGLSVGQRILEAVTATQAAVGCNTNLGIILLAAPLAQAALSGGSGGLRDRLRRVLNALTMEDAALAFRAIALAAPAGLGRSDRHDVNAPVTVTLLEAMAEAQARDRIARQYATGYADLFELGVPRLRWLTRRNVPCEEAAEILQIDLLACIPDSHVIRKYGLERAEWLQGRAAQLRQECRNNHPYKLMRSLLGGLDKELKYNGINPGTTADIVVACLFSFWLMRPATPPASTAEFREHHQ